MWSTVKVLFTISQPIKILQLRLLGIPWAFREFLPLASMIGSFVHFILYIIKVTGILLQHAITRTDVVLNWYIPRPTVLKIHKSWQLGQNWRATTVMRTVTTGTTSPEKTRGTFRMFISFQYKSIFSKSAFKTPRAPATYSSVQPSSWLPQE